MRRNRRLEHERRSLNPQLLTDTFGADALEGGLVIGIARIAITT